MSTSHGRCCGSHAHDSHDLDPCMAQEIAQAERDRILYEKLKTQSDRLLMNLNIRSNKGRVRGAVAQVDDDKSCTSSDEDLPDSTNASMVDVVQVLPSQFNTLCIQNKDSKVFLFCVPCDMSPEYTTEQVEALFGAFKSLFKVVKQPRVAGIAARFKTNLCVCGKCADADSRAIGTLRSVAMILKKAPSVVVTRNGGLVGVWSAPPSEPDLSLHSFVSKHL